MSEMSTYIIEEMGTKVTDLYKQGVIDGVKHINKAFIASGIKDATIDDITEVCKTFIKDIKDKKIDVNTIGDDLETTKSDDDNGYHEDQDNTAVNTSSTENVNGIEIPNEDTCKQHGMSGDAFSALMNSMNNPIPEEPDVVDTVGDDVIDVPSEDVTNVESDNE